MCGIVGAVAARDVVPILMEGLRRLEYRGYDSAGIAVTTDDGVTRVRRLGKVKELQGALDKDPLSGHSGISHTRWATHGVPSERNAHPHMSQSNVVVVHNGIIENFEELRDELKTRDYTFESETDTEVVAHRVHQHLQESGDLLQAVRKTVAELEGAYALAVMSSSDPNKIVIARAGGPVVIGLGEGENFVASDVAALLPVTRNFMFLEEGDVAVVERENVHIYDGDGDTVTRPVKERSVAIFSITCKKKFMSRRAQLHERCKIESQMARFSMRRLAPQPTRSWTRPAACTSLLVAPVTMPA